MKNLRKKLKKTNKKFRFFFYIVFILYLVSLILLTRGLILLSGIETFLRYFLLFVFFSLFLIYTVANFVFLILKKHKTLVIINILVIIFSVFNYGAHYYINKTYGYIDAISKDETTYTTNLITLASTTKINTVGMITEESDIEGHILPKEYINKNKLKYQITYYDDYNALLNDLYDQKIDGIFITSNYALIYNNIEKFNNIKGDTKVQASYSKKMKKQEYGEASNKPITEPFTILLMGVDSHDDDISKNPAFNGDTLMLISFNPKTLSATTFSIPRDMYVPISCNNNRRYKINSAAGHGTKCMIDTIENWTTLNIDYYMKINFKGVVALVEALGGINVDVPKPDIPKNYCTDDSNRSGQICLTSGYQLLNGEQALALSRNRKAFINGDYFRVQNQQLVLEGIIQKAKGIRNLNSFYNVLNAISRNLETNMSTKEMLNFYNVGKNILTRSNLGEKDLIDIQKTFLNGYNIDVNGASTEMYYEESLSAIVKAMKVTLGLEKPGIIKSFDFSVNNPYEVEIVGKNKYGKREDMLPSFIYRSLDELNSWNNTRSININIEYEESNTCNNNTILKQSVRKNTLISDIFSLTITVCKNTIETPVNEQETETEIEEPIEEMLE